MSNIDYVSVVPRIRSIENRLLDKAKIERMIDASSPQETFKILQETEYGSLMGALKNPEEYEFILSEELKRLYSFMYEVSPSKNLINIMSVRYDYHNIKVLLKGKALEKDFSDLLIPVGTVETINMKNYILTEDYRELSPIMRNAIEETERIFEESKDPQKIDIVLDKYIYKDMLSKAEALDEKYIWEFIQKSIDITNLKTLLRVKKQNKPRKFLEDVLIDGGKIQKESLMDMLNASEENIASKFQYSDYGEIIKLGVDQYLETGKLNVFEKLSDNFIMDFIKDAKYVSFGVEPLLAYIFAKENEIKIVRIIMVGKLNNIHGDVIRERLRDIYV